PQPVQDVLRARLVRLGPARGPGLVARDGPRGHRGAVQREVLGGPQHRVELDEVAAGHGLFEVGVPIAAAEPAPQHEVGAGRDRARRVQLQQRRAADEGEQVRRAVGAQPLRPHRHPPRLRPGELVNRHRDHGRGRPRHRHRGPAALTLAVSPHVLPLLGLTARRATLCWAARPGRHTCVVSSRRHAGPPGRLGPGRVPVRRLRLVVMARSLTDRAHAAVESLQHVPVRWVDRLFAGFGTLAATWLAFLLVYQLLTQGWTQLWAFVPFWLLVTYLILPRIHSLLSRIYLPDYFIGRTRTREGVLGDPVNLAILGTEEQIHAAMLRAGWRRADELNVFTGWRTVVATLRRRSYEEAPVSALYLFGRRQAFTYQQEVEGNPAKRHHVGFWPTPEGWLLPGGRRVDWLATGTFDRAVGLSLFTGQLTHRIDAEIDTERDHIIATLEHPAAGNTGMAVERLKHFSSGYHHRNGGGDRIRTDGDLPIVDLRHTPAPSGEVAAKIAEDDAEAAYRRPVPITVALGLALMLVRALVGAVAV